MESVVSGSVVRRLRLGVAAAPLLLALALPLSGCNESTASQPEVRPVRTVAVAPRALEDDRRAIGEVKPRYESDLGFRVAGKLVQRAVDVGAVVRKGDVLARLDEQDYRNRLKSAEADSVAAQAALVEAQGSEERYRSLLGTGNTTRGSYDSALKNLRSAEAKVNSARAALELARDQVVYSTLRAEFDGVVTAVGAEAGQVVDVGRMVVRLAQPGEKDAVFAIPETAFDERSAREAPTVAVSLLSNTAVTVEGVVREVSPVADAATRTYLVKVTLKNPPEQMRFGAGVIGRPKGAAEAMIVLPGSALFDRAGAPAVWVVNPNTSTVELKPIAVARFETDRVIVSDGLVEGDLVVTAGVNRLRENQKVRVLEGAVQ